MTMNSQASTDYDEALNDEELLSLVAEAEYQQAPHELPDLVHDHEYISSDPVPFPATPEFNSNPYFTEHGDTQVTHERNDTPEDMQHFLPPGSKNSSQSLPSDIDYTFADPPSFHACPAPKFSAPQRAVLAVSTGFDELPLAHHQEQEWHDAEPGTVEIDSDDIPLFKIRDQGLHGHSVNEEDGELRPEGTALFRQREHEKHPSVIYIHSSDSDDTPLIQRRPKLHHPAPPQPRTLKLPLLPKRGLSTPDTSLAPKKKPKPLHAPIVRPPFPAPIPANPVILGLVPEKRILTCFRLGEVIKLALSLPDVNTALVELYGTLHFFSHPFHHADIVCFSARVAWSELSPTHRNFQFLDLYHDRPPFLTGVYENVKKCKLWDEEAKEAGTGKMVRVVARVRRVHGKVAVAGVQLVILRIMKTDWEEVENVAKGVALMCGKSEEE